MICKSQNENKSTVKSDEIVVVVILNINRKIQVNRKSTKSDKVCCENSLSLNFTSAAMIDKMHLLILTKRKIVKRKT